MLRSNDKHRIIKHYDVISPYYRSLWGEHLHHGYWIRGDETKEKAQLQLTEHLAQVAGINPRCRILDVGCGFGASSIFLAKNYDAQATGITISSVQVKMAKKAAAEENVHDTFLLMNADAMNSDQSFHVVCSLASISHYQNIHGF